MAKKTAKKPAKKVVKKAANATAKAAKPRVAGAGAAIRELDEAFMDAVDAKDAQALIKAFYAPDAVLMPPNHAAVEGRAQIGQFLQGLIDSGVSSLKLETTSVASAGDLAYGRGRYTLSMSDAGEPQVGKYIVVYRRQANGKWQAVADIFNADQGAA